jgi:hypothetical protein
MYKKQFYVLITFLLIASAFHEAAAQKDQQQVIDAIDQFFQGMREGDSTKVSEVLSPKATLLTVVENEGKVMLPQVSVERFLTAVASPHDAVWDERIDSYDVDIDDRLASVWTPYEFYLGPEFSHCGVNAFQLYKTYKGWKIISITDTRRTDNCP